MSSNTQIEALQKIKAITEEKYLDIKTAVRLVGWLDRQREKISEIATEALASYNEFSLLQKTETVTTDNTQSVASYNKSNEEGDAFDEFKEIIYKADKAYVPLNTWVQLRKQFNISKK